MYKYLDPYNSTNPIELNKYLKFQPYTEYNPSSSLRPSSTTQQTVERQIINVEEFARDKGHRVEKFFSDSVTGKTHTLKREGYQKMIRYCKERSISAIFVSEISPSRCESPTPSKE